MLSVKNIAHYSLSLKVLAFSFIFEGSLFLGLLFFIFLFHLISFLYFFILYKYFRIFFKFSFFSDQLSF